MKTMYAPPSPHHRRLSPSQQVAELLDAIQEIRDRLGLPNPLITLADLTLTAPSV